MADVTLSLGADTAAVEAAIARLSSKKVHLGGINSKNFTVPLGRIQGNLGEFNKSLMASNARVLAFGASAGAIFAVQKGFTELVKATIEVDKKLSEINVVLGTSQKNLKSFGNDLFNAAAKAGVGFDAAAEAATEFSRQGLGLEKTLERVNDALVLSRLTGLSVADSVNAITAAINGYNLTLKEQETLTSRIIAVDQAFAVSGADIAEAMRRVASTAQGAGVSLNELIAIVTAAQQRTARGGAVIGNSFKTIFTRLQRPKTLDALEQIGIKVKDASGAMLPAMQVLNNLAKGYDRLAQAQQSQIAELVGGVFQINVLKAAIGDLSAEYSIYGNALEIANSATNEAGARNEELNKSMSAQLNALVQHATRIAAAFGDLTIAPALENIVSALNSFFAEAPEGESEGMGKKIGTGLLAGIGNILSGPGLLMLGVGLFKLFQFLAKQGVDAVKTIMTMGKATEKRAALEDKVRQTLAQEPQLLDKILKGEMNLAGLHSKVLQDIKDENLHLRTQEQLARSIAESLARRTVLTGSGTGTALAARAAGYIPNYAADQLERERRDAIRRGASPRVQGYYDPNVKIKGKKGAIVNTEESVVHRFAGGSESAVIPNYANTPTPVSKASKKTEDDDDSVPESSATQTGGKAGLSHVNLNPNAFGVISVAGKKPKEESGLVLTPAKLKAAGFKDVKKAVGIRNLGHFRPNPLAKDLKSDAKFKEIVKPALGQAAVDIAKELLGSAPDEIPNVEKLGDSLISDSTAYPQIAGRMLESSLIAAINDPSADRSKRGQDSWDFKQSDFNKRKPAIEKMFADGKSLLETDFIDSKLNLNSSAYYESMAKKFYGSTEGVTGMDVRGEIQKATSKSKGYIPNFANELRKSVQREHDAGIPYSQMRIHTDQNGQPIAVTNKKDEPRGMKDVGRSGGYIPNYASTTPSAAAAHWAALTESTESKLTEANKELSRWDAMLKKANLTLSQSGQEITEETIKKNKAILKMNQWQAIADDEDRTTTERINAMKKMDRQAKKIVTAERNIVAARGRAAAATTGAGLAAPKVYDAKAKVKKIEGDGKFQDRMQMAGMAMSMMGPALGKMFGASEKASEAIAGFTQTLGMAGMAAGMLPGDFGKAAGGIIALVGAFTTVAKYVSTMKFSGFKKAAESGKASLEKFNASAQATATAMSSLDAELSKAAPEANRVLELQKAYVTSLSELPAALRRQILSSGDVAEAQEALAKAQMEAAKKQKGREAASTLATSAESKTGFFSNMYGTMDRGVDSSVEGNLGGLGGAMAGGAAIGAVVGSVVPVIGTAVGAMAGAIIGGVASIGVMVNQAMKGDEAEVFGEGEDAVDLGNFTKDIAKSMDFEKLSTDIANGMDLQNMSGEELARTLQSNYGASEELSRMMDHLGTNDMNVLKNSLQILAEDAARAREEAEAMAKLMAKQAAATTAVNEAIANNEKMLQNWMATLDAATKSRAALEMANDQNMRKYWTAAAKGLRELNAPFQTGEAKAQSGYEMKNASAQNKRLDALAKIQNKTRGDMVKAVEKMGGEGGLDTKTLLAIRKVQEKALKTNMSGKDMAAELGAINMNGKALSTLPGWGAQMQSILGAQNGEMKMANLTATTQLAINKMQLDVQKKQLQQQKDIKTLGGLNTFMDPEGAGKKKAEDFEKGLKGYARGAAKGDVMQQGRGAIQLLRSAMDAGVDIMGPGAEGMKKQAIDANAANLRNTFNDRASRLEQQATELEGMGRGGEASKLREQAQGYRQQAGRAEEISENQIYAEFKKSQMPKNIGEIKDIDAQLLKTQQQSFQKRKQDFVDALNASGVNSSVNEVTRAIEVQTALAKQAEALKAKQKAETKKKSTEEALKTAEAKIDQDRTHLFAQAIDDASFSGDSEKVLASAMGLKKGQADDRNLSEGFEAILHNITAGSGGKVTNLRDLKGMDSAELKRMYTAGQKITGKGSKNVGDLGQVFGEGEFLDSLLNSQNQATKEYVQQMNETVAAMAESETMKAELAGLSEAFRKAQEAFDKATAKVEKADASVTAQQDVTRITKEKAALKGEKDEKVGEAQVKVDSAAAALAVEQGKLGSFTPGTRGHDEQKAKIAEKQKELTAAQNKKNAIETGFNDKEAALNAQLTAAQAKLDTANAAKPPPGGSTNTMGKITPTIDPVTGLPIPGGAGGGEAGGGGAGDMPFMNMETGQPIPGGVGGLPGGAGGGIMGKINGRVSSPGPAGGGDDRIMTAIPTVDDRMNTLKPTAGGAAIGGAGGGDEWLATQIPTVDDKINTLKPTAGGAAIGGAGGGAGDDLRSFDAGGGSTMDSLASNVGSMVESLNQGVNAFHTINFETPLPIVVTVQGEVSNLITPEDVAKIENAVISKLSQGRPQNNGSNAPTNVSPGQVGGTKSLAGGGW